MKFQFNYAIGEIVCRFAIFLKLIIMFQAAKERLKNIVSQAADEDNFQLQLDPPSIETLLNSECN